jgi:hypothetical protein
LYWKISSRNENNWQATLKTCQIRNNTCAGFEKSDSIVHGTNCENSNIRAPPQSTNLLPPVFRYPAAVAMGSESFGPANLCKVAPA